PYITIRNNNNASTPSAGWMQLYVKSGFARRIWIDDSMLVRVHTAPPTNATDTSGTVVGSQSSHIDYKDVLGEPISDSEALDMICLAAAQVARFVYKSGAYNNQEFSGIVLDGDELDRYGMDA